MILENIKLALLAIWTKKLRSFLTMLGVLIGVFSITTLLGIGQGVKQSVTQEVQDFGTNLLFILPGQLVGSGGGFNPSASVGASTLTQQDIDTLRTLPDVEAVSPISLASGLLKADGRSESGLLVLGTTSENDEIRNLEVIQGRFIEPDDETKKARIVVLGSGAATALFPDTAELAGKTITFRNESFTVIGLLKQTVSNASFSGPNFDTAAYFPFSTLADVTGSSQIFRIAAKVRSADRVEAAKETVKQTMLANHGGEEDFTVLTQDDLLKVFNSILGVLTAMVSAIAGISLVVGGIGIMNTILVAVTERTREIGLRKALGASSADIFVQFLTEAVVLGIFGGVAGIALAIVVGIVVKAQTPLSIVLSPTYIVLAIAFSVVVGVLFGVLPAIRASRLNPIDALKYE